MNQIATLVNSSEPTMNSLEISELVESRHDKVKQSIERLAKRSVIQLPPMGEVRNHLNQVVAVYQINKRDSYVIVAQLSPEFTARLVDRWQELESQKPLIPQTLPEALRLAADLAEQKQIVEQQLAIAAPKAEFVDRYVQATGLLGFRETSKLLKVKENFFRDFLISKRIMYKLAGKLTPYSEHLEAGRFDVKTGENQINGHAYTQVKFTPKGIQWIAGLLAMKQLEAA
ncbi:phage antirepressor KilAC domain-containing protein [Providencia sp. PROV157]|uniref:phage antirepressor KilAC domain-containing protein n=1 Tax=Providencia sp. PROV157 TaxID=2949867 RepID=UPI0023498774|nr:DNA-binding protein [Providencia sp. PROV157]